MTNNKTVTMSRELIERIIKDGAVSVAQLDQMRAILAAPVVERQEPVGCRYRKTDIPDRAWSYSGQPLVNWTGYEFEHLYTSPPAPVAVVLDPCTWTDRQVLDFLGVALRNVDLVGEVKLSEIRQGFEYMRNQALSIDKVKELNQ